MHIQKYILTFLIFSLFSPIVFAQEIIPCATPPVKSKWLKQYQKSPNLYAKGGDTTLYVPVTIHVLGTDSGTGYFPVWNIMNSFCQLNEDFAASDIQFFIEGELNYINNSAWYNHNDNSIGYQMMIANNIPNSINCYIVGTAAGAGGYNLPSANAIALLKSNIDGNSHTWAHEIGHNLSIQHPFLGWEGNMFNPDESAPTEVYYNYTSFKETYYNSEDTTILDTALVEYVARTNCYEAADGFCDTPPDYLSSGWQCNSDGFSVQNQKDPDGVDFYSDGSNFMSYASDACNAHFTPEQIAAMRANLLHEKPDYLYNQNPTNLAISDVPTLIHPIGDTILTDNVTLTWESVVNATHYYYQVNGLSNFSPSFLVTEGITDATNVDIIEELIANKTYYWRVLPFSQGYTCSDFSEGQTFQISPPTSINNIQGVEELMIYPNILPIGKNPHLSLTTNRSLLVQANLFDINGQFVQSIFNRSINGHFTTSLALKELPAGMYFIGIQAENDITYRKLIIGH